MTAFNLGTSWHGLSIVRKGCENFDEASFPVQTHLAYVSSFRLLSRLRFSAVVEVGPGGLSIPAVALKSSGLEKEIEYIAVDADQANGHALSGFLKRIDLGGQVWLDCFADALFLQERALISRLGRTVWCFEHSLEDLALRYLLSELGGDLAQPWSDDWNQLLNAPAGYIKERKLKEAVDTVLSIVGTLGKYRKADAVVMHHFLSPVFGPSSMLRQLDQRMLARLREIISGRKARCLRQWRGSGLEGEIFWLGSF